MKYTCYRLFSFLLLMGAMGLLLQGCSKSQSSQCSMVEPVDLVNTLMGTDSEFALSNGNTYPAVALPWGMNFWTPQTGKMGDGWGYTYDSYKIRGIKQTHQPSPWINDYAAFSLMAVTGELKFDEESRASWFSHKAETAKPYYYSVYLADHDVTVEVTPTERASVFQFTFPETEDAYILLDGFFKGSQVKFLPAERKIVGYCRNNSGGVPDNFHNYFVAVFDKDFDASQTWKDGKLTDDALFAEGEHVGAIAKFKTKRGEKVTVKVASSFISPEQAEINLKREVGDRTFEEVKTLARNAWSLELNKIQVEGGSIDDQKTFYSCLYRVLLFPRKFYEFDAQNQMVHYSPYNGGVYPGPMYTDNGFWDTFRAVFPFFTLMYPEVNSEIMQGLVNAYNESGWLPEWASPGHRGCMIGSNSASLIADSYLKGIRGYDVEKLYEAVIKNTTGYHPDVTSVGRYGCEYYNRLGYIPYNVGIHENTARTLEYAYADYCIWQLGKALGKSKEEIDLYESRSQNYNNVFDPQTKLMRGRNEDGTFQSPFNPLKWGDAFTEGNSLHYTWSVFHDVEGLKKRMGGNDSFVSMLDTVFAMPPLFDCSYYGFPIHEIREMQIANTGNYAHGNQPIQHMLYLYNYAGQPWKGEKHLREVMARLYTPNPDGYSGDEDNGQTSAWYVFSAMGFYPVCPGSNQYVLGSPLFDKVTLHLSNGKQVIVQAANNGPSHVYVEQVMLDNKILNRTYVTHQELVKGCRVHFTMSDEPNTKRGIDESAYPYSMSLDSSVKLKTN